MPDDLMQDLRDGVQEDVEKLRAVRLLMDSAKRKLDEGDDPRAVAEMLLADLERILGA